MPRARLVLSVAVVFAALVVQLTAVPWVPLPGATPDLVLLGVVALALRWGPGHGAAVGFGAGLALDLVPPGDGAVGQWALVLTVLGYLAGLAQVAVENSAFVPFPVVAAAAAGSTLMYAGTAGLIGDARVTWGALVELVPSAVVYDVALTPFVVSAVLAVARRVEPDPSRW